LCLRAIVRSILREAVFVHFPDAAEMLLKVLTIVKNISLRKWLIKGEAALGTEVIHHTGIK